MDTLELLKQLRFEGAYDSTQIAELASYNMVLHRQLNYIFRGFGSKIKDNRFRFHVPYSRLEIEQPSTDVELIQRLQDDLAHIVQMTGFVTELYVADTEAKIMAQHMKNLKKIFSQILACQDEDSAKNIHEAIQSMYDSFSKTIALKYEVTWDKNWKHHEEILEAYNEGSLNLGQQKTNNSSSKRIRKAFKENFHHAVGRIISLLYTKSLLGTDLGENEIALLTFIVKDLGEKYGNTKNMDEEDNQEDTKKNDKTLTYILKDDEWEKIDYSMRCQLWELIEGLVIENIEIIVAINDCGETVTVEDTSYDYSTLRKYLRITHDEDIRSILALIKQKIMFPKTYRIMNMLSDMTSFFALTGIEETVDPEKLDQLEKKLAIAHKLAGDIEQSFCAEDQHNEQIWAAIAQQNELKKNKS